MQAVEQMQPALAWNLVQYRSTGGNGAVTREQTHMTLVRNVSHEFRTPLAIALGYAELLRDGELGALGPDQQQALDTIVRRIDELRRIVDWISLLMAVETQSLLPMPVNLAQVATRVVARRRDKAGQAGVTLEAELADDLPPAWGDDYQVEQVIECLVENALKFTPVGGRVVVQVHAEPGWVCLTVSDDGIGIPAAELDQIFSGFYQVDGSLARRYGGLGLGLTVVRAVVQQHGGRVEVESQPGQGSRFLVRMPAGRPQPHN
jgi:two-component system phosphate regulon sensor histidine kinase PhoR